MIAQNSVITPILEGLGSYQPLYMMTSPEGGQEVDARQVPCPFH